MEGLSTLDSDFFCPICSIILTEPYLSPCGHHFCLQCLSKILALEPKNCPIDKENLIEFTPFLNKHFQKKVLQINLKCPNSSESCEWQGSAAELQKHLNDECSEALIICPFSCGQKIKRKLYEEHITNNTSSHMLSLARENESLKKVQRKLEQEVCSLKEIVDKLYAEKKQDLELKQNKEKELAEAPSAKNMKYTLVMSSQYAGPPNTYEALQTDDITQGAGTQALPFSFIEAQFPQKVKVSKITLAGPAGMAGGWSCQYTNGLFIQNSNDRQVWNDTFKVEGVPDGVKTFDIKPEVAQYWRLFNKVNVVSGYAATGVFRFE